MMRKWLLLFLLAVTQVAAQVGSGGNPGVSNPGGGGAGSYSPGDADADIQDLDPIVCTDAGANDTYTCGTTPTTTAYADLPLIWFDPNTNNTGAATINVDSVGAIPIYSGTDGADPGDNEIVADEPILLRYCAACNTSSGAYLKESPGGGGGGTINAGAEDDVMCYNASDEAVPCETGVAVYESGVLKTGGYQTIVGQGGIGLGTAAPGSHGTIASGSGMVIQVASGNTMHLTGRVRNSQGANVASAGTIAYNDGNAIYITGTTNIDTLNTCAAAVVGIRITLLFADVLTVGDLTGNFDLAGDFVTTSGDTLSVICMSDGVNHYWREISRSVN